MNATTRPDRPTEHTQELSGGPPTVELTAVIVAVTADEPRVLALHGGDALPSGPLQSRHRTLQSGVRSWVEDQTRHALGYAEQLYTFADRERTREAAVERRISISYLGLTRERSDGEAADATWQNWYRYFPWEDWRRGPPQLIASAILPRLRAWARHGLSPQMRERRERINVAFGAQAHGWNEEFVLQRYELLWEAGVVPEAHGHRATADPIAGTPMMHDHRRILATGIARLRAKIKYRPVVFELMPASFTLFQLQRAVEALAGQRLHKQNFRRLVEQQGLVEETSKVTTATGGRPAKLFSFRREVVIERTVAGTKLPLYRSG
ncbi:MAG: NUDIX hydrolase [Stellaceae bacterium]